MNANIARQFARHLLAGRSQCEAIRRTVARFPSQPLQAFYASLPCNTNTVRRQYREVRA